MQYCLFIFFDVTSINHLHERLMKNSHYIQNILNYICNLCMHIRNTKDTEPFNSVSFLSYPKAFTSYMMYYFFASSIVTRSISILICAFISSFSASFLAFSASLRAFSAFRAVISSCITYTEEIGPPL